jgi:hypothetical protein
LKKRTKKLLLMRAAAYIPGLAPGQGAMSKSFLVLFFKKAHFLCFRERRPVAHWSRLTLVHFNANI